MTPPPAKTSCLGPLLVTLTGLWLIGLAVPAQLVNWAGALIVGDLFDQSLSQMLLTALPLGLLLWRWPGLRERAIFRAWGWASGYLLILIPSRWLDSAHSQSLLLSQLGLSLAYAGLVGWRLPGPPGKRPRRPASSLFVALAMAALVSAPWLVEGAFGSALDTLLALALGLVLGWIAARILAGTWLAGLRLEYWGRGWDIFSGGLVAGVMLIVLASGLSFSGGQLLLMLTLPSLGWAALALSYAGPPALEEETTPPDFDWRPPALLIGSVTAVMLALVDTDIMLLEALDPGLGNAFQAAAVSGLIGWLLAGGVWLARQQWGRIGRPAGDHPNRSSDLALKPSCSQSPVNFC